jgi:predicted nucleic acid-binding protein
MRNVSRASVLLDTNVLVYRLDPRDRSRQDRAAEVFRGLVEAERAGTSAQCLIEFYRVVTQRLPEPFTPRDALAEVGRYVEILPVIDVTGAVVAEACRGSGRHRLSLWDALVWSSAKLNQVPYVLTEDAEHGRVLEGVTYLDPFDARFDLAPLLG